MKWKGADRPARISGLTGVDDARRRTNYDQSDTDGSADKSAQELLLETVRKVYGHRGTSAYLWDLGHAPELSRYAPSLEALSH